jgi:hypothetical protein
MVGRGGESSCLTEKGGLVFWRWFVGLSYCSIGSIRWLETCS